MTDDECALDVVDQLSCAVDDACAEIGWLRYELNVCRQSRKRAALAAKSRRCSYQHLKDAVHNLSVENARLRADIASWQRRWSAEHDVAVRNQARTKVAEAGEDAMRELYLKGDERPEGE